MTELLSFADDHPFLVFFLALLFLSFTYCVVVRLYRVVMVSIRGWPTAPNMDADGDIVHPRTLDDEDE